MANLAQAQAGAVLNPAAQNLAEAQAVAVLSLAVANLAGLNLAVLKLGRSAVAQQCPS